MSYARFGANSDVYLYSHAGGFVDCCGCKLTVDSSVELHSVEGITAHMREHVDAGHQVDPELLDAATYEGEDFVAMCDIFMCRENTGHEGGHTPLSDLFPNGQAIRDRQLAPWRAATND